MSSGELIVAGVLAVTGVLMLGTRLRADLVAISAALALTLLGVTPEGAVLRGLSSSVVLTLFSLFVIAEGLEDTGWMRRAATRLSSIGSGGEKRLVFSLMGTATLLSLLMNNVAVGALLVPAGVRVARAARIPLSGVLLPVAYATLLGGMATIFTSANIIMNDLLREHAVQPLTMLDFTSAGGIVAVAGLAYMMLVGRRLLVDRSTDSAEEEDYFGLYRLGERFLEFRVPRDSTLAGRTIEQIGFRGRFGLSVLALRRGRRTLLVPGPGLVLSPGDEVIVLGREERLRSLLGGEAELRIETAPDRLSRELELTELIVAPRSRAVGKTLADLQLRTLHGVTVFALWKDGRVVRTDVGTTPLQEGDGLLVVNIPKRLDALARGGDFVRVGSSVSAPSREDRAPVALAILLTVVAASFSGLVPIGETLLLGALTMVFTGCVGMEQAYRAVEWRVIFLVAGLLPLGFAMIDTGLAERVATTLTRVAATDSPMIGITLMFGLSVAATQVIGGQVSALVVGPVALAYAGTVGVDLRAMAVAVALGASTAFLTPIAHPVNVLMLGKGGYRPVDFLRVGAGLTLVTLLALLLAMRLFWGIPFAL